MAAARLSAQRVLILGCGQVGLRLAQHLMASTAQRLKLWGTTTSPDREALLRAVGVRALAIDLDRASDARRLAALAPWVIYLAPPPAQGRHDPRLRRALAALARGGVVERLVYLSTSGVYGDRQGAWTPETTPCEPITERAARRLDAEQQVRRFGVVHGVRASILRVPGIYSFDGERGNPLDRLARGAPLLQVTQDVYTNRIHLDDLSRACWLALMRGAPQRVYNLSDDGQSVLMGDSYDQLADQAGLPRAPRVSRHVASASLSPTTMSFLSESRRLDSSRMRRELRLRLWYPTMLDAHRAHIDAQASRPGGPSADV